MPDVGVASKNGTWNLENDLNNKDSTFSKLMDKVEDFNILVTSITISNYEENWETALEDKEMLIIGFDDCYQGISNDRGQVDAILDFIKSGKSVIFSHDTTSYINWDYEKVYNRVALDKYPDSTDITEGTVDVFGGWTWLWKTANNPHWGYSLNTVLRSIVGMDRYGIVTNTSKDTLNEGGTMTVSDLLRRGQKLTDGQEVTYHWIGDDNVEKTENVKVSFARLEDISGDVAYVTGEEERKESFSQTQGYSNIQLEPFSFGEKTTTVATKVNDGAITQYPFRIGDSITIGETHAQDLQLALERDRDINGISDGKNDIVVWYCLANKNSGWFLNSPNDVRNNYYFYSKGNVIYTGAGHRSVNNNNDSSEIKLFINAIIAAANATAVQPEVRFVKSLDPASETEVVRYYMTDQENWLSEQTNNVLEKDMDFYINVRDYNMVSSGLSMDDLKNQEMKVEIFIEDQNGSIQKESESETLPSYIKNVKMMPLTNSIRGLSQYGSDAIITKRDGQGRFLISKNGAYGFEILDIEEYLRNNDYRSNCKLYVKVTSTVTLYGVENNKTSWAVLDLKQRQLFNLD